MWDVVVLETDDSAPTRVHAVQRNKIELGECDTVFVTTLCQSERTYL